MIPIADGNSKEHVYDSNDDRYFHFVCVQELNFVLSDLQILHKILLLIYKV